jgi:LAO/AO transport system kinase
VNVPENVERARKGEHRAVARLISVIEAGAGAYGHSLADDSGLREVMAALMPLTGNARVIGLTGAPGVGKSTVTSAVVTAFRRQDLRVGVLAVDPSSPFSGGALLGDRIRMQDHSGDKDVYIRSMAARGHLGGVAWATPQAIRVLDAAGCDVILVETVGVGQSEVEVAGLADTTLVVLAPGLGDGIQAAKAGVLEIGDVFVVNKADRDGAEQLVRDLRGTIRLAERAAGDWREPIVSTVAVREEGIDDLMEAVDKHRGWLEETGELQRRRLKRVRDEVENLAVGSLRAWFDGIHGDSQLDTLAERVRVGDLDPYAAADELVHAWRGRRPEGRMIG